MVSTGPGFFPHFERPDVGHYRGENRLGDVPPKAGVIILRLGFGSVLTKFARHRATHGERI